MPDAIKKTPPPIKRVPAKKKVPKKKIVRKAAKIEESHAPMQDVFGGLVTPGQIDPGSVQGFSPADVTPEQLQALKQENFLLWCVCGGIKVDHKPFDIDSHKYLIPMYLDRSKEFVLMKAAQMGATIFVLLKIFWFCLYRTAKACFFFPTQDGVNLLSKDRLTPIVLSNEELIRAVQDTDTIGYKKIGASSALYLRHLGGIASKDSTPFDFIAFDEVRLLDAADIDQARERISHSEHKYVMQVSTAGLPHADIHKQFLQGTQNYWHTKCNCPDGVVLSDTWPDCVAVAKDEVYYRCPRCKMRINDPQNGRFIPHNPGAEVSSYHIHQMMSRFISPSEVWRAFQTTQNLKEFYNAKLGKPYVDEAAQPVDMDDLIGCENDTLYWGPSKSKHSRIGMGVDQMSGLNYVVIAELAERKKRILHFEIIDSMNNIYMEAGQRVTPFKRLYQLIKEFDVDLCIIDAMPNANEAMELARAFPKRVFVAWYLDSTGTSRDMVQWGDRTKDKMTTRKGGPKIKFKYTCVLNRFLTIDFALAEIANRNYEWANPDGLLQIAREIQTGRYAPQPIFRNYFYLHMTKIIKQKTPIDEATGRFRMEWVNLGMDPHSVHALNYCNIALERLRRQPIMTFA